MSEISNKAIMIAVSLLVTIAITSSIITVMGYFKDIYAEVKNTDISLRKNFTEYDMYDNTVMTGIDIENAYNKYKNNPTVNIVVNGQTINALEYDEKKDKNQITKYYLKFNNKPLNIEKQDFYAIKYNVTCNRSDSLTTIIFTK